MSSTVHLSKRQLEMVGGQFQTLTLIEAVGVLSLDSRVELDTGARLGLGPGAQPLEEPGTVATRAFTIMGDEVVHVKEPTPNQGLEDPEAGDGHGIAPDLDIRESVAGLLLGQDAGEKGLWGEEWTELLHHGKTRRDLFLGFSDSDTHLALSRSGRLTTRVSAAHR